MPSINSVFLAGYCDGDPRVMGEHGNIVSFRLRMHEQGRKRDGTSFVRTEYVTVKAFGSPADYIGINVNDGTGVLVQGRIRTERWGGPDARKKETLVVADRIQATGTSEEEELLEIGVTQEPQDQGSTSGNEPHQETGDGHEQAVDPGSAALSDEAVQHDAAPEDAQPAARTAVEMPQAGTPEFEKLKGIQAIPWD